MNKLYCLFLLLSIFSCIGKHKSDVPNVMANPTTEHGPDVKADTLGINIERSRIEWIATEMRGAKRRTGIISFKKGFFLIRGGEIVGGNLTVDMETMDVTDIPIHEKVARKNLLDHLKSDDFFNVSDYPLSTMKITNSQKTGNDSIWISGNLTIRAVTKSIEFPAHQKDNIFKANFSFNRLNWNIAYEGSWADRTIVDKDVELKIEIVTE